MQIITDLSLLATLASTVAATSASSGCSTVSTTITTTVATMTVTVTPGASSTADAGTPSLSHSLFTSGTCSSSVPTTSSSSAAAWTSTKQAPPATTTPWSLSTYTSSAKTGTTTVTQCVAGAQQAGVNTVPGADGTTYIVCAGAPHPTVSTITGKPIADPLGGKHTTTAFSFYPTGHANSTTGTTATGTGSVHATPTGIVPFTGGAASLDGKKTLVALGAVAIGMLFV
ncbi:hypothetical protein CKM354_000719800 [Cercospora kikuchii]|uniref:Uncharacterized protein n=1 Tax=Cercospora kikuchii TaxID=84275 RepID=A0A9P3CGL9_9PEZI|nr:uncharacterized protein CKM354_000719800 [Cercospora kikuchii]GIZ43989.1 hypothetical protein CKM354_000719800 [Cercospora kikuchii]